ncbi:jg11585 [Pararge aegeria aegeria]|uniref:Jg11585 protein n=1 Tax=Pararge aegeria aegeria TaxID=348720 RepID=A0A8S4RV82_9NEOP|nr:jg11585 [Pararge aegeria aegeria]
MLIAFQLHVNKTYYDKDENPLRVPKKFYEERKKKSKITKSPKRTIQKIIKNGKSRSRKIYVNPMTRKPTQSSVHVEITEASTYKNNEARVSTEHNHKRKPRKNSKIVRYPMPFHKFQTKKGITHKRNKREVVRDDVFIIKDLDEMEFLSKDKDYDVVKAHIKNYW